MDSEARRSLFEITVATLVSGFFVIFITLAALFIFGGVENNAFFDKSVFYFGLYSVCLFALWGLTGIDIMVHTTRNLYKQWGWANALIYDPDCALLHGTFLDKYIKRPFAMFNISLVFFLVIGMFAVVTNTAFTGIVGVEQQVTTTGDLLLATEPASTAETLLLAVVLSILTGVVWWWAKRAKLDKGLAVAVNGFVIPILFGLLWTAYHGARYAGQDTSLWATFVFGTGSAFLTIMTGSVIGAWVWHVTSNMLVRANQLFSDDRIVLTIILFIVGYLVVLGALRLFGRNSTRRT